MVKAADEIEATDGKAFQRVHKKPEELLTNMRRKYKHANLDKIHQWKKGKIPRAYCNVKDKDNDKSRLISASHEASLRTLLKLAGKALTHLLIHLPEQYTQFTLHSLADLNKRITDMSGKLIRTHRDDTQLLVTQADV